MPGVVVRVVLLFGIATRRRRVERVPNFMEQNSSKLVGFASQAIKKRPFNKQHPKWSHNREGISPKVDSAGGIYTSDKKESVAFNSLSFVNSKPPVEAILHDW